MALGSVLLKPQPVAEPLPPRVDAADLVADFIEVLSANPEGAAAAGAAFMRIVPQQLQAFTAGLEEKVRLSDGRIRELFRPFSGAADALLAAAAEERFVDVLAGMLQALDQLLAQCTAAQVTALVRAGADVLQRDLGLSDQTLRDGIATLAVQVVAELQRDVIQGQTGRDAMARYEFGAVLAGFKSLFDEEEIELPAIGVDLLVDAIERLWARGHVDRLIAWVRSLLARRDDVLAPLAAVIEARVSLQVGVAPLPRARGAAARALPAAEPIAWYASWVAARTIRYPADPAAFPSTLHNPELVGFHYRHVGAPAMEKLAFHSAWALPAIEALLLHATSMEQGDVMSNLHVVVLDAIDFGLVLGDKGPVPGWWQAMMKPLMTIFLFALEPEPGRGFSTLDPYNWFNALGDLFEVQLYWRWSRLARELLLSFFTLLNHQTGQTTMTQNDGTPVLRNTDRFEGLCLTFWELGALLVPAVTSRTGRHAFGFVGGGPGGQFFGLLFGGAAVAAAAGYGSVLLVRVIAGDWPPHGGRFAQLVTRERLFGPYAPDLQGGSAGAVIESIFKVPAAGFKPLMSLLSFATDSLIYSYLLTNGATDGGTYAVDANGVPQPGIALQGYPAADASPYLLPWSGKLMQCVQGNLGPYSHYAGRDPNDPGTVELYAYDFGHDLGEPILCARAGILTFLTDTQPDNNPSGPNRVEVMHLMLNPLDGLPAVVQPMAITTFNDGVTAIPAGTLFPPYWDAAGQPLPGLPNPVPLHPSAAILPGATASAPGTLPGTVPAYYKATTGFNAGTTFGFLQPGVDRGVPGLPAGATFSDGSPVPVANGVVAPGTALPPLPGTDVRPAGTEYVYGAGKTLQPLSATFSSYLHCLHGFMQVSVADAPGTGANMRSDGGAQNPRPAGLPDVYATRNTAQVLGLFVPQGRVIALAGDTGVSAFNHLHTHVCGSSRALGDGWTLPFSYRDAHHGIQHGIRKALRSHGVPRSSTFYSSENVAIAPADAP